MALKLSIGFQKKIGLPDYGSAGANCQVEFEIDRSEFHNNLEAFHEKARQAFIACQQAVNDQLSRQAQNGSAGNGHSNNGHSNGHGNGQNNGYGNGHPPPDNRSSDPTSTPTSGGNGHSGGSPRPATQSQARAIRAIASKQRVDLPKLLEARFGVGRPENLRLSDASTLIDELKGSGDASGGQR